MMTREFTLKNGLGKCAVGSPGGACLWGFDFLQCSVQFTRGPDFTGQFVSSSSSRSHLNVQYARVVCYPASRSQERGPRVKHVDLFNDQVNRQTTVMKHKLVQLTAVLRVTRHELLIAIQRKEMAAASIDGGDKLLSGQTRSVTHRMPESAGEKAHGDARSPSRPFKESNIRNTVAPHLRTRPC